MTPEQLGQLVDNLRRFEGSSTWMYLDTHDPPLVTVGIGVMLPTVGDAVALPFQCVGAGRGATENEVAAAYARVQAMRGGMGLHYYQGVTDIELTPEEVNALAVRRLNERFIPAARAAIAGFDSLPWPAQQALIDIEWNAGGLKGWPNLCAAVLRGDWARAAAESHVSTSRPERNAWRAEMFSQC